MLNVHILLKYSKILVSYITGRVIGKTKNKTVSNNSMFFCIIKLYDKSSTYVVILTV
jgi:hypothetical protein